MSVFQWKLKIKSEKWNCIAAISLFGRAIFLVFPMGDSTAGGINHNDSFFTIHSSIFTIHALHGFPSAGSVGSQPRLGLSAEMVWAEGRPRGSPMEGLFVRVTLVPEGQFW